MGLHLGHSYNRNRLRHSQEVNPPPSGIRVSVANRWCRYYSPQLKAWIGDLGDGVHDGSANDPRIGIIRITATTATYSLQKGNPITRGVEIARGAVTGHVASVNRLRELHQAELQQYRETCVGK